MSDPYARRRQQLRAELDGAWMLVTTPQNVRYLSGFTGSNAQVLLGRSPVQDYLITDARYRERAGVQAPALGLVVTRSPFDVALQHAQVRLVVEGDHVSWRQGQRLAQAADDVGLTLEASSGMVETLRAVKDEAEVAALTQACQITTQAMGELFTEVAAPGHTEAELARWLERRFVDLGADDVAFDSIIAAGPNGAIPHHEPTDRPISAGDLLTVDAGAKINGYHADCTRTVAISHVNDELERVHNVVERAQAAGRAAVVAGGAAGAVDQAARRVIEAAGYARAFVHGTGHGVGLAVHEAPAISPTSDDRLAAQMVCTVEPGVYLPGIGGVRIEDTVVVTDGGPAQTLTELGRGLQVGAWR